MTTYTCTRCHREIVVRRPRIGHEHRTVRTLCTPCERNAMLSNCIECRALRPIVGQGLCPTCYTLRYKIRKIMGASAVCLALSAALAFGQVRVSNFNADINAAIASGAAEVVVDFRTNPYVVAEPIRLRSGLTLRFESGVVVEAAPGAFLGEHECLIWCERQDNIRVIAHGATFRMRQTDYKAPPYKPGEHRHVFGVRGCASLVIEGGTYDNPGGDGLYLGSTWDDERRPCRNIEVRDATFDRAYRNGISITSATHVLIERCTVKRAGVDGVNPRTGIDLEPNSWRDLLQRIRIVDTVILDSSYSGIAIPMQRFTGQTQRVSIEFVNCLIQGGCIDSAMQFGSNEDSPAGYVILDVRVRDTIKPTIKTHLWKSRQCALIVR